MTETAEIYTYSNDTTDTMREKVRALEAEETALLKKMDKIRDMRMELQNECRHEEGFAASGKYTGLEFCVICRKPRLRER
jgi:hypothetical protein